MLPATGWEARRLTKRKSMKFVTFIQLTFLLHLINTAYSKDVNIAVDIQKPFCQVEEAYLSVTLDTSGLASHWSRLNFSSVKLHTLLHALSPAYLRVGGSSADWLFFDKPLAILKSSGITPRPTVMTKKDFLDLVSLSHSTNNRLLFDLNLQLRFGQQWDPSLAIELFKFCESTGIGSNIDWELGNEPDDFKLHKGLAVLSGEQIAESFIELKNVLKHYPHLSASAIVGPDIGGPYNRLAPDIIQSVVNQCGDFLKALTFHHYYFEGDTATYKDYLNPENFGDLVYVINLMKAIVAKSKFPNIPLWLGESSDAWHSGSANISDRFVSGFLWLEKLGLAARMGIKVVMRQTLLGGNYALLDVNANPSPDYWLSVIYHTLVGQVVLDVNTSNFHNMSSTETTRVYAHCTNTRSGFYKPGTVTVFALNISPSQKSHLIFTNTLMSTSPIDVYILSPGEPHDGVLSKSVVLNNQQQLKLVDDHTLPIFKPIHLPPESTVTLEPLTFGFFVFTEVNANACLTK